MLEKIEVDSSKITSYWWVFLILIGLTSLIIKLYFLPLDLPPSYDTIDYFGYAIEIKNSGELPKNWPLANNGWPAFVGVLFSILQLEKFFDFVNTFRILSVIVSVITIIPIYFLCSKFFGRYLGLFGAALFAFEPKIIQNSTNGGIESMYMLVCSLVILLLFQKNYKTIAIAFVLVGVMSHLRYEAFIMIIPITIIYFLTFRKKINYKKNYLLCISLFLIILVPLLITNYYTTGEDGLFNQFFSAINRSSVQFIEGQDVYKELAEMESQESSYYLINGAWNFIKFIGILIIPVFIFLIPYGIFAIFKKRNSRKNIIIILSSFLFLAPIYAYINGFNDIRYLFILYPIFCFVSLFTINKIIPWIKKPSIFLIVIIIILILFGIYSNLDYKNEIEYSKESFIISQNVVNIATVYNEFSPEGRFIKAAEMENKWPTSPIASHSGHIIKDRLLIKYDDSETLQEFIQKSRQIVNNQEGTHPAHRFSFTNSSGTYILDPMFYWSDGTKKEITNGLSHLIVDNKTERPKFIQDIFQNENKYTYLKKVFDSKDFELTYKVKIFEIDHEEFDKNIKSNLGV